MSINILATLSLAIIINSSLKNIISNKVIIYKKPKVAELLI